MTPPELIAPSGPRGDVPGPVAPGPVPPAPGGPPTTRVPAGAADVVSRRSLLKGIGAGLLTVVVAGTGVVVVRGAANRVLDYGGGHAYDPWRDWERHTGSLGLVSAAILAANPHNTQPWIFHVSDAEVVLTADPSRNSGALDPLGREQQVGFGCALENLALASGPRGRTATIAVLPTADPDHIATVAVTGSGTGSSPPTDLYRAIGDRRSDRGPYGADPVAAADLAGLSALVGPGSGVELQWLSTAGQRAATGALMIDAATAIVADHGQSVDGFAWFRSTEAAIQTHRDGLTDWGQDLGDPITSAAVLLPPSSRTAGDQFWLTQTKTVHTRTAAAYGVLTVVDPADPRTRIEGGRVLQRLHLAATAQGLAFQHMNQVTERIDREASLGRAPTFAPRFDALLGSPGRLPLASFRIGHPVRAARRSPRRPVSWLVA